jgi:uncharacterized RDD family membrane protein YckC
MNATGASEAAERDLVTPEGVPLRIRLAGRGDRAGAFLVDMLAIGAVTLATGLLAVFGLAWSIGDAWAVSVLLLATFLIRVFYFTAFELRWQGQTPGKRLFKLRVIDRHGGTLRADAVVVRNFMREVEVFLPLTLFFAGGAQSPEGLWAFVALGWVGILMLMPLFNHERLRVGDMVAGTWVIEVPRRVLLPDLAAAAAAGAPPAATAAAEAASITFSRAQLDVYGIYELQTLEEVLRGDQQQTTRQDREEIANRIARKIGWQAPRGALPPADDFLAAFYVALRAHLEKRMLLGDRRESKHYPKPPPRP